MKFPYKKREYHLKGVCILLIIAISYFALIYTPTYTYCATSSIIEMEQELEIEVDDLLGDIDFAPIDDMLQNFNSTQAQMFSITNVKDKVKSVINGENAVDYTNILQVVLQVVIELLSTYTPMFALIIGIGVIASLLGQIKSKFAEKSTVDIVHFVCFCLIVVIMASSVNKLVDSVKNTLGMMQTQINVLFPVILTLMAGIGSVASVGVFQPVLAVMSSVISVMITKIAIPIFLFSFVLNVIGHLSSNVKLDKFSSFLSSLFKWIIGITFTIFFAVMSIQGISAGAFDSVSLRTAKFTVSSYVPIMGGYLSQGMDLILASGVLIKNSVGLVGILIILSTVIAPILEIVIFSLLLKAVSAIIQPLGNTRITNFMHETSKTITMLSTCIIVVGFMYFVSIGLCMATANVV